MTEGDRFNACMVNDGFFFPRASYQFVRLLKASPQTRAVRQAIERLERVFDEALARIASHVDFDAFEVINCDTLARVQLGSGLIVLNSILEAHQH
jgi:HEAT repeat protein